MRRACLDCGRITDQPRCPEHRRRASRMARGITGNRGSTSAWRKLRARIIERDGGCAVCSAKTDLQVHHIDGNANNDEPANLITLCAAHHTEVEAAKRG